MRLTHWNQQQRRKVYHTRVIHRVARLAPLLDNDRGRIELMNGMLMSFRGTPVVYYGEEIGMGDNIYLGDRDGVRTPMQWNGGWNGGFSSADPDRLYAP
jgi:maltose alpha-D-glucosyltransferase/alpha-amylase